ncbi:hypothetical protein HPB51_007236 [Rhipicephalus microplus]|uniref:DNA replication complex GINS protein PSF1 n=1 Tax=Rhipicephalus microplus TaxID=6941 RepID=A0A9J6E055_RHIMP|nr:hypothetical protein HPB51_007236 [Rhipicephalus microplus]
MVLFVEKALELVKELKRSRGWLPPLKALFTENQNDVETHMENRHTTVHASARSAQSDPALPARLPVPAADGGPRDALGFRHRALRRSQGEHDLSRYRSPPKSLYVQVRCLKDYGDFETEDGTRIVLARDTTHFLERSQCEKLIHQGIVEHVTT